MFKLPEDLESKYRFVTLAALRAEQLQAGALPRLETASTKSTVIAQEEVAQGVVQSWSTEQDTAVPVTVEDEEEE